MVNVTKSNFIEQSNDLIRRLPTAAFVAIDEEMTGITLPKSPRPRKDHTVEERYQALKAAPEKYQIIQLGVCLFHEHDRFQPDCQRGPELIARRYNFYMFPSANNKLTREVTLNPSAIAFLGRHGMNFDTWTKEGISFVSGDMAETFLELYQTKQENKKDGQVDVFTPGRKKVELRRTEDIDFHARAMASLREWLDSAQPTHHRGRNLGDGIESDSPEGLSFLLPAANSFLRRALYESISTEYPSLILENAGPCHPNQIRVLRLDPGEKRKREDRLARESWEDLITNQIGVWRVFMALSLACQGLSIPTDSITFAETVNGVNWEKENQSTLLSAGRKIPVVVHNGLMDLLFLLSHFHNHALPSTWALAKAIIHNYFPVIYDTKFMATECASSLRNESTYLENLFLKIVQQNEEARAKVELVPDVSSNLLGNVEQAHDAAYDAFMTGAVYYGICKSIISNLPITLDDAHTVDGDGRVGSLKQLLSGEDNDGVKSLLGRNKLYLMQSIYSLDLEIPGGDPLFGGMIPEAIFRITNFDPSVTTRTIIHCLSGLVDRRFERVNFEIFWVDDTTFLVAATPKQPATTLVERVLQNSTITESDEIKEHGRLILNALKERFPREEIKSWPEYLAERNHSPEQSSWALRMGRFFRNLFGLSPLEEDGMKNKRSIDESRSFFDSPRKRRRII